MRIQMCNGSRLAATSHRYKPQSINDFQLVGRLRRRSIRRRSEI